MCLKCCIKNFKVDEKQSVRGGTKKGRLKTEIEINGFD